jgi:single-stranded-DNA-specific exonuclease
MSYKIRPELNTEQREKLSEFSDIVSHLLFHRGITDNSAAQDFLNPNYEKHSYDFGLLKDIDKTVERILQAVTQNEKICIFSDYDADGIPGAVVLSDFFKKIGYENVFVYIPHRNKEGFGLNSGAIEKISEDGAKILITIDCGISDVEQIQQATDAGIDVIITDHHDPNGHQSSAYAVVNPKQPDCKYPDKNLCGSGVIFKVVQALVKKIRSDEKLSTEISEKTGVALETELTEGWEKWLLDMVGIATLSDMVPLVDENRVFAKYGLLVMQKSRRKGFQKLLKIARLNQNQIAEDDVGFTISPRINAASRMDSPELAFQMLSTDDDVVANDVVKHLDKINNERKGYVAAMVKEINKVLSDNHDEHIDKKLVVYGNPNWQPSLLGLAASSIVGSHKKPVFLWGRGDGDNLKGSCRSDGSLNLVELMNNVDHGTIYGFGGHAMAGGFEVTDDGVFNLHDELEKAHIKTKSSEGDEGFGLINVDRKILIDEIDWKLFNEINKLAPFGVGNEKPVFLLENVKVSSADKFGKTANHTKLLLQKNNGSNLSAIKFFSDGDEKLSKVASGDSVNLIVNLEKSTFGRYPELRLRIVDIL